jgi:hypothetical protein
MLSPQQPDNAANKKPVRSGNSENEDKQKGRRLVSGALA